jgi:hypothetical protein
VGCARDVDCERLFVLNQLLNVVINAAHAWYWHHRNLDLDNGRATDLSFPLSVLSVSTCRQLTDSCNDGILEKFRYVVGDGGAVSGKPVITVKVGNPFTLDRHRRCVRP